MVKVGEKSYYMNPHLVRSLDAIKKVVQKRDQDAVYVVDGPEGSGKSTFAMQIGCYLDPTLELSRVCMEPDEFRSAIIKAKPHQCVIYDEAYTGLSSRASLSSMNKILVSMMMEMRQKNLFVIIVLPTIFLLDRYVALFRSRGLFHIYTTKTQHRWLGFNRTNKKLLYLKGKKEMNYGYPHIYSFKGRFYGKYVVDEEAYRLKKRKTLEKTEENADIESKYKVQRDILIDYIAETQKLSLRKLSVALKEAGFDKKLSLSPQHLGIIRKKAQKFRKIPPVSSNNILFK